MFLRLGRRGTRHRLTRGPARGRAVLWAVAVAVPGLMPAIACRNHDAPKETARLSWTLSPDPPRIGPALLVLSLQGTDSRPITGARWSLEGFMTHPGMQPVVADVTGGTDGRYEARLSFTMAGDWVLVARADWAQGHRLERSVPLRVLP